jgi:hypothetical protein
MLGEVSAPGIQRNVALLTLVLAVSVVLFPAQMGLAEVAMLRLGICPKESVVKVKAKRRERRNLSDISRFCVSKLRFFLAIQQILPIFAPQILIN